MDVVRCAAHNAPFVAPTSPLPVHASCVRVNNCKCCHYQMLQLHKCSLLTPCYVYSQNPCPSCQNPTAMASRIAYFRHGQDPELVYAHTARWPRTRELREQVATKHDLVQAIRKHVWDLAPSFVVKLLTGEMLDDFQDSEPVPLTAGVIYIETIPRGRLRQALTLLFLPARCSHVHFSTVAALCTQRHASLHTLHPPCCRKLRRCQRCACFRPCPWACNAQREVIRC